MSSDQPNLPEDTAPEGSLRSPLGVVKGLIAQAKHKPLQTALFGGGLLAVVLLAAVAMWITTQSVENEEEVTLDAALEKLDSNDFSTAKRYANILRKRESLPYERLSTPAFVLGAATYHQAQAEWNSAEKRKLYIVAARYLEESRARSFPPDRAAEGLLLLAESLHRSGRYSRSLPVLREAMTEAPQHVGRLHQLLATAYLHDSNPNYQEALKHNRAFLSDRSLPAQQRNIALLNQAEILFGLGEVEQSREVLGSIPNVSHIRAEVILMRGRMLMHEADQLLGDTESENSGDHPAKALEKYTSAIKEFRLAQANSTIRNQVAKRAKYLLGVCLHRMGDDRAAEAQFSQIHPPQFEVAESIAAGLEQAEVKRALGKDSEAVMAYRRVLEMAGDPAEYSNPWVSLDELRQRLYEAYTNFIDNRKHEQAIALTAALRPMYSHVRTVQMRAEAMRSWAESLASQAADLPVSGAEPILVQSRSRYRKAGIAYAQLARLKVTSREYPDEVWRSAENYLAGHDYVNTVRMLEEYLTNRARPRTPQALVAMGQAQLALGNLDEAITSLETCIDGFPIHPDTYRARLIASDAHVEKGQLTEAKKLLTDNLHNEALTPRSADWRDSLFALGKVFHQEGVILETESRGLNVESPTASKEALKKLENSFEAHQQAAKILSEAVFRYPDAPKIVEAQYSIAQSHSQSAKWPGRKLAGTTIETTKLALGRQMHDELQAAMKIYDSLLKTLNDKQDQMELNAVESAILRNCYFARADILFDIEDYEGAIAAYSTATNRYHGLPDSLEAYVQIARCYRELGKHVKARGSLEQAKVVLRRVVDDEGFTRTTRYSREEWIELLEWLSTL